MNEDYHVGYTGCLWSPDITISEIIDEWTARNNKNNEHVTNNKEYTHE